MAAAPTLRIVGGPNYAQFGNRVHAGRVDVRAEADHADRANDLLMGRGGLERRDEPGEAVSRTNPITRAKNGGRGTSDDKAACGEGKEQGTIGPDPPTTAEENQGRLLGSNI